MIELILALTISILTIFNLVVEFNKTKLEIKKLRLEIRKLERE